jgi:hypothetical protein
VVGHFAPRLALIRESHDFPAFTEIITACFQHAQR